MAVAQTRVVLPLAPLVCCVLRSTSEAEGVVMGLDIRICTLLPFGLRSERGLDRVAAEIYGDDLATLYVARGARRVHAGFL